MQQRIIGITGGIATGKSTVSEYLNRTYGLPILDADIYAREALTEALVATIAARYGDRILSRDRTLDRAELGKIIFRDVAERQWLEAQIHPFVRDRLQAEAAQHQPSTVVMVIPLLFESGMQDLVTEVWVVTCTLEQQLERLMQRNNLSESEAKLRVDSQMSLEQKIALSDIAIDNSGREANLNKQIEAALNRRNFDIAEDRATFLHD